MKLIGFIEKWEKVLVPCLLIILSIILFHGIFETYAFTDDYDFLLNASHSDFINVFIQGGRPIFGFLMKWFFTSYNTVDEAYLIRFVSLIGVIIFINYFYFFLRNNGFGFVYSLFVILLLLFSPSLDIKVIWTLAFSKPYISIVALLSGQYMCKAVKVNYNYSLLAIILGIIVLLTYQPIYTLSIIPLFLYWLKNKYDHQSTIKILILHIVIYGIYYVIFKLSLILFDLPALGRSGIDLNLIDRTWWFVTGPVKKVLIYNFLFYKRAVLWIIMSFSVLTIGIFLRTILKRKNKGFHFLYFIFIVYLSMLPNILSSDDWISYRTMGTLFILFILIIAFVINQIELKSIRYSLIGLLVIIGFMNSYFNVNRGFIDIQVYEYSCLKHYLESTGFDKEHYSFKQPEVNYLAQNEFLERVITDEYGRLSTSSDWVPAPMVKLLYKQKDRTVPEVLLSKNLNKNKQSYHLIDMEKLFFQCSQ